MRMRFLAAAAITPVLLTAACSSATPAGGAQSSSSPSCSESTQRAAPHDPTAPQQQTHAPAMPLGVIAQIREALPCNFSGMKANAGAGGTDVRGTFVIYLAPLNSHTRAVADAIIERNPQFGPRTTGTIFELQAGKQSEFQAEQQIARLVAESRFCFVYQVQPDGSLARGSAEHPGCPGYKASDDTIQ
jgi:hypothetical protein